MNLLKESARRVQNLLSEMGYHNQVMELPDSTRTAQEAAEAIGCEVSQIAKSLIYPDSLSEADGEPGVRLCRPRKSTTLRMEILTYSKS